MNERKDAKTPRNARRRQDALTTKRRHAERSEASRSISFDSEILRCAQDDGFRLSSLFSRLPPRPPRLRGESPPGTEWVPKGTRFGTGFGGGFPRVPRLILSRCVQPCPAVSSIVQDVGK